MSCIMSNDRTLATLANYAPDVLDETSVEIYETLQRANWKAFQTRYPDSCGDRPEPAYRKCVELEADAVAATPVEIFKLCDFFEYQCDEWREYDGSIAAGFISKIRAAAGKRLAGYDDADWGL